MLEGQPPKPPQADHSKQDVNINIVEHANLYSSVDYRKLAQT